MLEPAELALNRSTAAVALARRAVSRGISGCSRSAVTHRDAGAHSPVAPTIWSPCAGSRLRRTSTRRARRSAALKARASARPDQPSRRAAQPPA